MVDTVLDLLRQQTELFAKIREASEEKKAGIVENEVDKVSEAVKREWALLGEATLLEEQRSEAVAEALGVERKPGEAAGTLSDLEAICSEEEKASLEAAAKRLREAIACQQELNAEIQSLVDLHLEYTNYMVNMVFAEPQVSNIYGTSGYVLEDDRESGGLHGIIDSEV